MEIIQIPCSKCSYPMPKLRLTKYGYDFCVDCSDVSTKRGIPITRGSGDHTWTETIVVEEDQYQSFVNTTNKERGGSDNIVTFKLD